MAPLTDLLKNGIKFTWNEQLRNLLSSTQVLVTPNYGQRFYIRCDASKEGIGGVLYQLDSNEEERPIAFLSKKLNPTQKNYSTTEQECLAAVISIRGSSVYDNH